MKSNICTLFALALVLFLLPNCKKENDAYKAFFFTDGGSQEQKLSLFVNGQYKGDLPYLINHPTWNNEGMKQQSLPLSLVAGKYNLEARDQNGNVKSSSTLKMNCHSLSNKGTTGGTEMSRKDEVLVIGLFPN